MTNDQLTTVSTNSAYLDLASCLLELAAMSSTSTPSSNSATVSRSRGDNTRSSPEVWTW